MVMVLRILFSRVHADSQRYFPDHVRAHTKIGCGCFRNITRWVWHSRREMKAFVIILFALVAKTFCRPTGAPIEACSQLIPQHPPSVPLAGRGPYTLEVEIPSVGYAPGNGYERTCGNVN